MRRRDFLKLAGLGAASLALPRCQDLFDLFDNGEEGLWGMNVHPYDEPQRSLQLQALRDLGIQKVRITLGLDQDLAGAYIAAFPATYVGLLADYDYSGVNSSTWPAHVRRVMNRSLDLSYIEVLNEPDLFLGLSAATYVESWLRPAYDIIKAESPGTPVVAAAPRSTQDGLIWFYQLSDAGADSWCDYRAAHIYNDNPEQYKLATDRPLMVTETGSANANLHVSWWRDTMARISGVLDTTDLFWYALMDNPQTGYNLISPSAGNLGQVVPVSPLYAFIRDTY